MARKKRKKTPKQVESLVHADAKRTNIPTAELESIMDADDQSPIQVAYQRRNPDLDPQLIWRGKDVHDWSDLVVPAPPLFIQEKVHPKVLVDDLLQRSERARADKPPSSNGVQLDLFADFNGIADEGARAEFYQHDANWTNRMILGDSLQVMASLAEREGLRGKVQCIYLDPPYGIKFNSNFQWSTTSRDVRDGKADHITREPEQVKAFRDTWRDGIHSYLTYLRDRLVVARDLLSESGSIFIQIGDENIHFLRGLLDEVFGNENFVSLITFRKTSSATADYLAGVSDYLLWYAKSRPQMKYRHLYAEKKLGGEGATAYGKIEMADGSRRSLRPEERRNSESSEKESRIYRIDNLTSQRPPGDFPVRFRGKDFRPGRGFWKTHSEGMGRLDKSDRIETTGPRIYYVRYFRDFSVFRRSNSWTDTVVAGFASDKTYVVETSAKVVERCLLMATDPGDLVLDPTCGSGTTGFVAERWGRRWITIDTSRVALALARARIMGARYPYYLLTDSPDGKEKEAEITRTIPSDTSTGGDVRQGFVYERVPHIMLRDIANNAEIDVIWEEYQEKL